MTVLTAFTSLNDIDPANPTNMVADTTPAYLAPGVKECISFRAPGRMEIPFANSPEGSISLHAHLTSYTSTLDTVEPYIALYAGATRVIRIMRPSSGNVRVDYLNDADAWVNGQLRPLPEGVLNRLTIAWKFAADGYVRLYANDDLLFEVAISVAPRNVNMLLIKSAWTNTTNVSATQRYSAVIICQAPTQAHMMNALQRVPDANGALQEWSGDYTNVNKVGVVNDATFIESANVQKIATFKDTSAADLSDVNVKAVIVAARARRVIPGEGAVAGVLRVGGNNIKSAPKNALDHAFGGLRFKFDINPATGQPFTLDEALTSEFGVEAAASVI